MNRFVLFSTLVIFISVFNSFLYGQIHIDTAYYITEGEYIKGQEGNAIITYERPISKFVIHSKEGFNFIYRVDGSLYMKGIFKLNKDNFLVKSDSFFYYYNNGRLRDVGVYKNGSRVGPWEHYSKSGVLEYRQNYDHLNRIYYYPDGNIRAEGKMINKDINKSDFEFFDLMEHYGIWKFYFPDHTCECKGELVRDLKHGKWTYYKLSKHGVEVSKKKFKKYVANYNYIFLEACKW